jgi:hypothetical protein
MSSNQAPSPSPGNPSPGNHRRDMSVDSRAGVPMTTGNVLRWAQPSGARRISPDASPPTASQADVDRPAATARMTVWDAILEGFAAYGASFHMTTYPECYTHIPSTSPHRQTGDVVHRLMPARSEAVVAGPGIRRWLVIFALGHQRQRVASGKAVGALWAQWRRERDIRHSIMALETFGGRPARDIGLHHWSDIEETVRSYPGC